MCAVINKMPPRNQYGPYRGYFDFYTWKGKACVRQWPRRMTNTPRALATFQNMLNAQDQWKKQNARFKQAYYRLAMHAGLTGRDLFCHYAMQLKDKANFIFVDSVDFLPHHTKITFAVIKPQPSALRYRYHSNDNVSDVVSWEGIGEPYCRAHYTDFFRAVFRGFTEIQVPWHPHIVNVFLPPGSGFLWFYLTDPYNVVEYASGLYMEKVT